VLPTGNVFTEFCREVTNFVDHFMALCFMARCAVHLWKSVYGLLAMDSSYQLQQPFCSKLCTSKECVMYVMMQYTLEQCLFLCDAFVKYGSARKCWQKF
jgi:hypothetical protein